VRSERGAVKLARKPRAVLAMLLMHPNQPVSWERLAGAVWGEEVSPDAKENVQVNISRLRKALGDAGIVATEDAGYTLRVAPGELDADRFARYVEDGRRALAGGQAEHAASLLREGLALWRGPPFADMEFEAFAQADIARLEEQRLAAIEARVAADLAAGRHDELVGELRGLVKDHPTREQFAGQLMLALYRCGRQAEALDAYRDAWSRLDEIGVEPGLELRELQEAVLRQDPSLDLQPAVVALPPEVDAATVSPLVGREDELAWLREHWDRVRHGSGALVALTGPHGMGKTRLAAELAEEVHRAGAPVLYAAGTSRTEAIPAVLDRARAAADPTLLLLDDADRAPPGALAKLVDESSALRAARVLAVVCGEDPEGLAALGADDALRLRPLDETAVGAIAASYAPDHTRNGMPARWLLEASDGLPRRVHELASQWARREAAQRVEAVAGRAAAGRAELRSMEAELAGGVVDLRSAGERLALVREEKLPVVCPFKGLAPFDAADADYYFGREQLVAEVVARLVGAPLLGVVGPSGSGKSSALRAGLLPSLAGGVLPGSQDWTQVLIRPGEHPLHELQQAVTGIDQDRRVVLAVDQFEETFTACRDEQERAAFVAELVRVAQDPHRRGTVVLAIRADHYGHCAAYPGLAGPLAENHVLVGPMRPEELRDAVEGPALRAGLLVEHELTRALLDDIKEAPGALPLLSAALLDIWQRRDGRRLTHSAYLETGGVHRAVARLAEDAFAQLDPDQQVLARSLMVRLAREGPGGTVERRRVPLAELDTERSEDAGRVFELFTDRRLLTVSAGSVEVAHEALLREWPRLRGWIEEDRAGLRIRRNLTAAAEEWRDLDYDEDVLYRGARLTEADEWRAGHEPSLNRLEREFLDASDKLREGEQQARRRRLRWAFAGLLAALGAISAIAIIAIYQGREADRQRDIAVSRGIAASASSALSTDPALSLSLALRALDVEQTDEAATVLRQATLDARTLAVLRGHRNWVYSAAFSPDGRRAVSAGDDGRILLWDLERRRLDSTLRKGGPQVFDVAFSPDGRQVAAAAETGAVELWGVGGGDPETVFRVKGASVSSVAFSPDGEQLVAALSDGTVRVSSAAPGSQEQVLRGHDGWVFGAEFSPDGERVMGWGEDGTVRLWEASTGAPVAVLRGHADGVPSAAFSPDGREIVSAGYDATIRVWSAADGQELRRFAADYGPFVVGFSPDGRRIVSGSEDGAVRVFDAFDPRAPVLAVLRPHEAAVLDARFSPNGHRVISASQDGTVRVWDPGALVVVRASVGEAAFSSDGRRIFVAGQDGRLRVWSAAGGPVQRIFPGGSASATALTVSPDGRRVASGDREGELLIWRVPDAPRPLRLQGHDIPISGLAFSADGRRIVSAGLDGRVHLWSPPNRSPALLWEHRHSVYDADLAPDGTRFVAAGERGALTIRSVGDKRRAVILRGHRGAVNAAAFSPDGGSVVSGGADGTVRVWSADGRPLIVMRGHEGPVNSVAFREDGRRIVSAGTDGTVRVWHPRQPDALVVLDSHRGRALTASFDPAGQRILSAGSDDTVRVTPCEVCGSLAEVLSLARARAERQLTAAERERFLPDN
jgi:WD40 repeat protein/DNA-binding SARP family transcriptional activator